MNPWPSARLSWFGFGIVLFVLLVARAGQPAFGQWFRRETQAGTASLGHPPETVIPGSSAAVPEARTPSQPAPGQRVYLSLVGQQLALPEPVSDSETEAAPTARASAARRSPPTEPPDPAFANRLEVPAARPSLRPVWPFGARREGSDLPIPPRLVSVVVLGVEGDSLHWHSDSIQVLMLNPDTQRIGIVGLPRDAWVAIPGYGHNRINVVDLLGERDKYPGGGPALLQRTLWENFALPMDFYARVRFDGFIEIIDTLGGAEVMVECPIDDLFPHPSNPDEVVSLDLSPGPHHLDGVMTLLYARSRWSTNDYDRSRRQQTVLKGLFRQAQDSDILTRLPQLYEQLAATVQTDLQLTDVLALARHALLVEPENVDTLVIDRRLLEDYITPEGAAVLLLDEAKIQARLHEFFTRLNQPASQPSARPRVVIENQTASPTWGEVAASRVAWAGGEVVASEGLRHSQSRTSIISYTSSPSATLTALTAIFGVDPSAIVDSSQAAPDRRHAEDIRVIVGNDFQPCRH
jgi:LCP family protein required for cell wall assembly